MVCNRQLSLTKSPTGINARLQESQTININEIQDNGPIIRSCNSLLFPAFCIAETDLDKPEGGNVWRDSDGLLVQHVCLIS